MDWAKSSRALLRVLTFPFWLLLIKLPNWVDNLVFLYQNRNFRLTRPNCVFLINSISGKKLGPKIFAIAQKLDRGQIAFDILKDDYVGEVRKILASMDALLHLIVCGGDGTVNSVIDRFEEAFEESQRDRLIYIPMALGTGNDMSRSLNISPKVNINFMNKFFQRVDSPRTAVRLVDRWKCRVFAENTQQLVMNRSFVLYLGIGYDAETTVFFDWMRKGMPWMFRLNTMNKVYYGLIFAYLLARDKLRRLHNSLLSNTFIYTKNNQIDVSGYGNILVLNSFSRASGTKHEWDRKRGESWAPQRMDDGKLEIMGVKNWMQICTSTIGLSSPERIAQSREFTIVVNSETGQKRPFHVDGDGIYITGSFSVDIRRIRAVKFLCYDDERPETAKL